MPDRFDPENAAPMTVPFTLGKRRGIFAKLETEGTTELVKRAEGTAQLTTRANGEVR